MRDLKEEIEDSGKKDCPISVDCWMSCLSGEINNWTVIFYMLGTMFVTLIIVISSIIIAVSEPQPKLFIEQICSIWYTFIFSTFALFIFFVFISIHKRYQKIVEPLKKIRRKIISGELNTPDKIRECWKKRKEEKSIRDKRRGEIKIFLGYVIVALLIAPAMLVAPPLSVAPYILGIPVLFAVACILMEKLKENEEATNKIKDRFLDVLIGIISGLVASYLMWVLLTFGEISISLLFPLVAGLLAVAFSLVVIWVFVSTKWSR